VTRREILDHTKHLVADAFIEPRAWAPGAAHHRILVRPSIDGVWSHVSIPSSTAGDLIMKSSCTLRLAAFLAGGLATAALAATSADENSAGQTTTPTSPTMTSSKAAPGAADHPGAAASPHTGYSAGVNPNAGTPSGTNDGTDATGTGTVTR
jgi:hypothetical protein